MLRYLLSLALLAATPAVARDIGGAWKVEDGRVSLRLAGIAVPERPGTTALTQTGEFSQSGSALDNFAKYESADGKVFATAYVYRATYADAALAASATDRAIRQRFGADLRAEHPQVVPIAGQPRGAIRQVYTNAVLNGERLVTTAAFARVGGWTVKLRATGPIDRGEEVTKALDALIAGVTARKEANVYGAALLTFTASCPLTGSGKTRLVKSRNATALNLFAGLLGGGVMEPEKAAEQTTFFPRNGADHACVAGTIELDGNAVPLLRAADQSAEQRMIAPVNDAGMVVAVEPAFEGSGYTIKQYAVGEVAVAGTVDRLPSPQELQRWLTTRGVKEMAIQSRTTVDAAGKTTININSATLK